MIEVDLFQSAVPSAGRMNDHSGQCSFHVASIVSDLPHVSLADFINLVSGYLSMNTYICNYGLGHIPPCIL